jgi:MFS family permease
MSTPAKISPWTQIRTMGSNFWFANLIEMMERLAFFGVRAVLPLYIINTTGGGLGLSYSEKAIIYGLWAIFQCLIPMVSGGYTEAYGYKKSMFLAFTLNIGGYVLMANATGFWTMLAAALCVGTGTAIFKPPVQGGMARSLSESNSGLGFGIFYWVVNVGGFFAPMAAAALRGNEQTPTWSYVFYGAAIVTAINFLPAIFLFKEPPPSPEATGKKPARVFADTMKTLFQDRQMLRFLLIVSGFWVMFMQLWDLLPNFLDEWVDARDVGGVLTRMLGGWAHNFLTAEGAAKPEMIINIDSFTILLLTVPLAWAFGRMRMMTALVIGMIVSLVGFVGAGMTMLGWMASLMIFVFAIGEAVNGPKFSEYIGMSAPPEKRAQYMGYSNIPFAFGWGFGNFLSGPLYQWLSSRTALSRHYLVERFRMPSADANAIPDAEVLSTLARRLGTDTRGAVEVLWSRYHPWTVWLVLGGIGLLSLAGMVWNQRTAQPRHAGVPPAHGTEGSAP